MVARDERSIPGGFWAVGHLVEIVATSYAALGVVADLSPPGRDSVQGCSADCIRLNPRVGSRSGGCEHYGPAKPPRGEATRLAVQPGLVPGWCGRLPRR